MPTLYIIAGPNGAGKTTASNTLLPEFFGINQFVNADEIAKGLSPFAPESVSVESARIMLLFLWLNSPEVAMERVKKRVTEGGHNIPEETIVRRYFKGIKNLSDFMLLADEWLIFDNSYGEYERVAKKENNKQEIFNLAIWEKLKA
jgi:predicted ABC-type ATPase